MGLCISLRVGFKGSAGRRRVEVGVEACAPRSPGRGGCRARGCGRRGPVRPSAKLRPSPTWTDGGGLGHPHRVDPHRAVGDQPRGERRATCRSGPARATCRGGSTRRPGIVLRLSSELERHQGRERVVRVDRLLAGAAAAALVRGASARGAPSWPLSASPGGRAAAARASARGLPRAACARAGRSGRSGAAALGADEDVEGLDLLGGRLGRRLRQLRLRVADGDLGRLREGDVRGSGIGTSGSPAAARRPAPAAGCRGRREPAPRARARPARARRRLGFRGRLGGGRGVGGLGFRDRPRQVRPRRRRLRLPQPPRRGAVPASAAGASAAVRAGASGACPRSPGSRGPASASRTARATGR